MDNVSQMDHTRTTPNDRQIIRNANIEGAGFMVGPAANHQGAAWMFWLQFWESSHVAHVYFTVSVPLLLLTLASAVCCGSEVDGKMVFDCSSSAYWDSQIEINNEQYQK